MTFSSYYMDRFGHVYPNQINQDDVRVAVLNPEDAEAVGRLVRIMEDRAGGPGALDGSPMLDMTLVLREFANPTPPKPDEPQGLGAVVRDASGNLWIRWSLRSDVAAWRTTEPNTVSMSYAGIDAVEVLSAGWSA